MELFAQVDSVTVKRMIPKIIKIGMGQMQIFTFEHSKLFGSFALLNNSLITPLNY